mmetsp:Transcript_24730/g.51346  ORF Transcript_24730/g.51346 Transcript_24730/m.51346 type:complete len:303 (-) Transcript_24730:193-1101(-)
MSRCALLETIRSIISPVPRTSLTRPSTGSITSRTVFCCFWYSSGRIGAIAEDLCCCFCRSRSCSSSSSSSSRRRFSSCARRASWSCFCCSSSSSSLFFSFFLLSFFSFFSLRFFLSALLSALLSAFPTFSFFSSVSVPVSSFRPRFFSFSFSFSFFSWSFLTISLTSTFPRPSHSTWTRFLTSLAIASPSLLAHFPFCFDWARMPKRAPPVASKSSSAVGGAFSTYPFKSSSSVGGVTGAFEPFCFLAFFSSFLAFFSSFFFMRILYMVFSRESLHHVSPISAASTFSCPRPASSALFFAFM